MTQGGVGQSQESRESTMQAWKSFCDSALSTSSSPVLVTLADGVTGPHQFHEPRDGGAALRLDAHEPQVALG